MTILIAMDKFKGSLTATQAGEAVARGLHPLRCDICPIADGGEGTCEAIVTATGGRWQEVAVTDAIGRPAIARYGLCPNGDAVMEMSAASGLAQVSDQPLTPHLATTFGTGAMMRDAVQKGARRIIIGIGGSATNDGGFGMASALGWQFFDTHDQKITRWTELHSLALIRPPENLQLFDELIVAVDVQNPLLGEKGCTRVYGPQKGLKPTDFDFAEQNLGRMADLLKKELHLSCADLPGTGAAGGLGFGLKCFAGARLEPGFQLFAEFSNLLEHLRKAGLVITGEGAIDKQTLMGKGVGELALLCQRENVPCIGLAGIVTDPVESRKLFNVALGLTPDFTSREKAMTQTAQQLELLAAQAGRNWSSIA